MAAGDYLKVVAPSFGAATVTVTGVNGTNPTLYTNEYLTATVSNPFTVASLASQSVYVPRGSYTLSVLVNSAEGADTRKGTTVPLTFAGQNTQSTFDYSNLDYRTGGAWVSGGSKGALAGLSVGKGPMTIPVGLRAHGAFDVASNGTDTSIPFRFFVPLTDPTVDAILPVFSNQGVSTAGGAPDTDAPNPINVACSVETSDAVNIPGTFNGGAHTVAIPAAGSPLVFPDAPLAFGAQVSTTDKFSAAIPLTGVWMRTNVSVAAALTSATGTLTSGSSTVTDTAASTTWLGRRVAGTGIPTSPTYVGSVIAGTSYTLSSTPVSQAVTAVNATASGTPTITFGQYIPFNITPEYTGDVAGTNNSADATLYGAAAPSSGAYSAYYGPVLILGRSTSRKPIVLSLGDSIFDGYSEDFHSNYQGPILRACRANGFPMVKLNRGGETSTAFNNPSTRRFREPLIAGCTHAIVEYGTNDGINSGTQATNVINRLVSIGTYLNTLGIKAWVTTIPPRTSSTDTWATTGNQTDISLTANLATINQAIRGLTNGLSIYQGYIDMEGACSSAQDSGKWGTSKTSDGVHPSDTVMRGAITTAVNAVVSTWSV
jgi:hypothetical protein